MVPGAGARILTERSGDTEARPSGVYSRNSNTRVSSPLRNAAHYSFPRAAPAPGETAPAVSLLPRNCCHQIEGGQEAACWELRIQKETV